MLAKKYRFHSRGGVKYTYRNGRSIRTPKVALIYAPNTRRQQRFCVVVSKKVLKTAVGRNRIRRRVYEAIRLELPRFYVHQDNIIVIYSRDFTTMPFDDLRKIIHDLFAESQIRGRSSHIRGFKALRRVMHTGNK